MDKYDYLVEIFKNIQKNILHFKYRPDDFYRNTKKIKLRRRIKNKKLKLCHKRVFLKIIKFQEKKIIYMSREITLFKKNQR